MKKCLFCQALLPNYYKQCPICKKSLANATKLRFISPKVYKENPQEIKFSAFVENSTIKQGELND